MTDRKNNLDLSCAKIGKKIVDELKGKNSHSDIKNAIQKSLGVLQEDGIYAFYVYLKSEGCVSSKIAESSWNIFNDGLNFVDCGYDKNKFNQSLKDKILNDLDKTFLAKDVLEKTMIYTRYHAKALSNEEEE